MKKSRIIFIFVVLHDHHDPKETTPDIEDLLIFHIEFPMSDNHFQLTTIELSEIEVKTNEISSIRFTFGVFIEQT